MAARRRRMTFRRGRTQNGRQSLWVQSQVANISLVAAGQGVYSGLIIEPSDWERELHDFTKVPKRAGGPRLEGLYLSVFSNLIAPEAPGVFAPVIPEMLVHTQSSQFSNIVTSGASFLATFQNARTLMYDPAKMRENVIAHTATNGTITQYSSASWHIKSRVRLAETSIGVSVRHLVDVSAFVEASVQLAFRAYLTLP